MFEDLINEMRSMSQLSVSVEIETDENGYIDKQCSNEKCEFIFKVNGEDWLNIPGKYLGWKLSPREVNLTYANDLVAKLSIQNQ